MDPIGIWTIGWGHAIGSRGKFLKGLADKAEAKSLYPGGLSMQQCEDLLKADLLGYCRDVSVMLTVVTNDNQFAAMVCFAFNLGVNALKNSTLLRLHNAGDFQGASGQFARWNKAGGKVLKGLVRRRAAESALYLKPME